MMPTEMIEQLRGGPRTCMSLARVFGVSNPNMQSKLNTCMRMGLVKLAQDKIRERLAHDRFRPCLAYELTETALTQVVDTVADQSDQGQRIDAPQTLTQRAMENRTLLEILWRPLR